jgi:hypothetical protein
MSAYANQVLSTPKVLVDGTVIKVLPNTVSHKLGGEVKSRFVSTGGGSGTVVHGVNAETMMGHVKFDMAVTAEAIALVRKWKQQSLEGVYQTIELVDSAPLYFANMCLGKDVDIERKSDGKITCEFDGDYIQ